MLKTLQRKAHQNSQNYKKTTDLCLFYIRATKCSQSRKSIQIGEILQEKSVDSSRQKSVQSFHECYSLLIAIKERIADSKPLKRVCGETMSQIESETQLSAPISPFEPISEESSPNGTRKAENLPHYKTSIPHCDKCRFRLIGITLSIRCPPNEPLADDCYCIRCQNALLTRIQARSNPHHRFVNHRVGN